MIKGGRGGGNTLTGLIFEDRVSLIKLFSQLRGYSVKQASIGHEIFFESKLVAHSYSKYTLYQFLGQEGVDWKRFFSKRLIPDEALYVVVNNTLYIIEIKFQHGSGSVDEKLQTCDFKKKQYKKIMSQLNTDVEYVYILSDWFKKPEYKDTLDYVISVGCHYYFNYLPLNKIGLPVP
ncbi:MAG: hypothetical protein ACOY3I_07055 [Verrucomicrobiota bacterium]